MSERLRDTLDVMPRGYFRVFQYGSNMNPERLNSAERLNGKACVVGVARLQGYGIRFDLYSKCNGCAVTDIVTADNEYVLGVLYDVPIRLVIAPAGKRSKMDRIEGALPDRTGNYQRVPVNVAMDKQNVTAVTYAGTDAGRLRFTQKAASQRRVSEEYFGHLRLGAQTFNFPAEYRAYLERQAGIE
jgi:hypothetical protein